MINVTKAYMPNVEKYKSYVDKVFESGWLTNRGVLLQELERRLATYLNVKNVVLVANGSLALQICYKALGIKGKAITTPFSFAATASTLNWEGIEPIFSDIDPLTFNLCPDSLSHENLQSASAIVPVHVFGNPCEVERYEEIARKYQLKVVYDAAHAFGVQWKGKSVLEFGNASTVSFHSTKLFHTIEGGAIITDDDELAAKCRKLINFGITGPTTIEGQGTNAKMNELEAAMGLCVLDDIGYIVTERQRIWSYYEEMLRDYVAIQKWNENSENNFAYAPILFNNEETLLNVEQELKKNNIIPRRYFYPSLNMCEYTSTRYHCMNSESVASRILCLPIYPNLDMGVCEKVVSIVKKFVV
ncbi:DegT/DnrJ/EryC1/StrS family aminotransferase [Alteromonas sp. 009811495]|uniref:DegT/DnrJ/EryC1/StrS family aminotransferase n=1 Tax=Alteromonas sp. 009811495 TaxID=3002962 RepID=UPI00237E9285|nr:DegT/DnrJ/EryC1/StrS family aminotransferase [Alteromonas sp. 009811495]WDT85601.1 DegT/DnrJ/EryC1/StrS family aminotransferase [Alteromonas sp. 009811495]